MHMRFFMREKKKSGGSPGNISWSQNLMKESRQASSTSEGLSEGDTSQQDQTKCGTLMDMINLNPFGIAISGCIDGFSRKVMWLRSGSTNNDPGIIALVQ
ncbi:hypothetical protein NQZ68_032072 [Dissostichus eleginoides]|nr:hypothetical protein NQZ68_032072 [Dissostichus eleginoides]